MNAMKPAIGPATAPVEPTRFRLGTQVGIALLAALITPFTALAWPFALLTGIVIGRVQSGQRRGDQMTMPGRIAMVLAVAGGIIAMIVFGLILGGLVSFLIAALASLSEQRAGSGTARQRAAARILLVALPTLAWLLVFSGSGLT